MADVRPTEIVRAFWDDVWNAHDAEAGGRRISGLDEVQHGVQQFLDHVNDLHVNPVESVQNEDGTRVTSRWVLTGTNNGMLGTQPNGKPTAMTGTAVWSVADGKLPHGWVEQASDELYHSLLEK